MDNNKSLFRTRFRIKEVNKLNLRLAQSAIEIHQNIGYLTGLSQNKHGWKEYRQEINLFLPDYGETKRGVMILVRMYHMYVHLFPHKF